jgi:hypothetical protein
MSMAFAGPTVSVATTIFSYFRPSKSPFYGVIAFGTAALILSCERIDGPLWWAVSTPIWCVLALALLLSFQNKPLFDEGQYEEQLRFARSFGISSALLSMVLTARAVQPNLPAFWGSYLACLLQVVVFLLYTWARSATEEHRETLNFVQFSLITMTLLVGASYALTEYVENLPKPGKDNANVEIAYRYLASAVGLYLLWASCVVRWIMHLGSLIKVEIPRLRDEAR